MSASSSSDIRREGAGGVVREWPRSLSLHGRADANLDVHDVASLNRAASRVSTASEADDASAELAARRSASTLAHSSSVRSPWQEADGSPPCVNEEEEDSGRVGFRDRDERSRSSADGDRGGTYPEGSNNSEEKTEKQREGDAGAPSPPAPSAAEELAADGASSSPSQGRHPHRASSLSAATSSRAERRVSNGSLTISASPPPHVPPSPSSALATSGPGGATPTTSSSPAPPAPSSPSLLFQRSGFLPTYKVLVVGDVAVGKTNLLSRYCRNAYDPTAPPTIGIEFFSRQLAVPTGRVGEVQPAVVQLWDTAGQERSSVVSNAYYRNAVGAMLVYDVTRRDTFLNVPRWAAQVRALANEDCLCVVVGNKTDTAPAQWAVTLAEGEQLAHTLDMRHYLVSAFNGDGVLHAFTQMVLSVNAVQSLKLEQAVASFLSPQSQRTANATSAEKAAASDGGEVTRASPNSFFAAQERTLWTMPSTVPRGVLGTEVPGHVHPSSVTSSPGYPNASVSRNGFSREADGAGGGAGAGWPSQGGASPGSSARTTATAAATTPSPSLSPSHAALSQPSVAYASNNGTRSRKTLDLRGFGGGGSNEPDASVSGCAC